MKMLGLLSTSLLLAGCMSVSSLTPAGPLQRRLGFGSSLDILAPPKNMEALTAVLSFRVDYEVTKEVRVGLDLSPGFLFLAGELSPFVAYRRAFDDRSYAAGFLGLPLAWTPLGLEAMRINLGASYGRMSGGNNYVIANIGFDPLLYWNSELARQLEVSDEMPPMPQLAVREGVPLFFGLQDVLVDVGQDSGTALCWSNQILLYHLRLVGISSGLSLLFD